MKRPALAPICALSFMLLLGLAACRSEDDADQVDTVTPADGGTTDGVADAPAPGDVAPGDLSPGDAPPPQDTLPGDVPPPLDVPTSDGGADVAPDVGPPTSLDEIPPDLTLTDAALDGPVRVYRDGWGVPHVYATTRHDAFYAQGWMTANDRLLQMHLFRMAGAGRMAEVPFMGPGDLAGDVYMRTLDLRGTAAAAWTMLQEDPDAADTVEVLESYAEGVNAFVGALADGSVPMPGDLSLLGGPSIIQDWTPVDSLIVGRVQSWDLSFDGYWDKLDAHAWLGTLRGRYSGTPEEGIIDDVFDISPVTDTSVLPLPAGAKAAARATPRARDLARNPFYARLGVAQRAAAAKAQAVRETLRIAGSRDAFGSNSWALAAEHTESGVAVLANDPHLRLRNPSIFYQIQIDTAAAGGDLSLSGVSFPGIPALILGRNAHVAWSATVFAADVTDIYLEEVVPGVGDAPDGVVFDGGTVPIQVREEILRYPKPVAGCEAMLSDWTDDYEWSLAEEDGVCVVTLGVEVVPHHGPVVPGSRGTDTEGAPILLTWKWVGFQPTPDLKAVFGFNLATSVDEFIEAARFFGVGDQNWLAVDTAGNIGYAAWMFVPRRPWTEQAPVEFVPWLPLPGTGGYEWDGWVPHEALPNAKNPEKGWLATANNDGWGVTLDGDPLNDGVPYHAWVFDIGLRAGRITERLGAAIGAGEKLSVADLQALQGDHHSPLGERMRQMILDAVQARAESGDLPSVTVLAARDRLAAWSLDAASGAWPDATQAEIDDSVAAAIFNAWVTRVTVNTMENKGLVGLADQMKGRLLVRMVVAPESLATWDAARGDTWLWDDLSTADVVETRADIVYRSLEEALAFLANPDAVGPDQAGGFGTDDMDTWRWGRLHTVQLTHPLGGTIPPVADWPWGYPRPGDRFSVDASHSGLASSSFRYGSGPAMRAIYVMDDTPGARDTHFCVIPGGQTGRPFTPHYQDEMALWARNQAHPVIRVAEELVPEVEWTLELTP